MHLMRLVSIKLATVNAIINTEKSPVGFNRHGTLHGEIDFYSDGHALSALMLIVAWVRELSWWATYDPSFFLVQS